MRTSQSRFSSTQPLKVEWANICHDPGRSLFPENPCRCELSPKPHWHLDQEAFEYGPFPLCVSGGYGASKTYAMCLKALWLSDTFPRNRGVIARKVWTELQKTTMSTFFKLCPPAAYERGGRRSDQEKILRLNNGSEILWMHLDDPDIDGIIRGLEINWFLFDQAEELSEGVFDTIVSRLGRWDQAVVPESFLAQFPRWYFWLPNGNPAPPSYAMLTVNPDTELHWIYRRFHPESPERTIENIPLLDLDTGKESGEFTSYKKLGYRMWMMDSLENRFLPVHQKQYLLSQPESFRRRFVHGQWGIPEGQIHSIDPLSLIPGDTEIVKYLLKTCTMNRTLDYGDSAPTTCGWEAVDKAGNVFVFMEYYQPNQLISDHRSNILAYHRLLEALRGGWVEYQVQHADPSIFYKTMQKYGGRWSIADEYSDSLNLPRETALYWQPADNDELGTRNRINEYLRIDPERVHPFRQQKGSPRLFFITKTDAWPQGCYHVIRETRAQRHVQVGTDLGKPVFSDERDENIADHAYDFLRYFMASRSPAASERVPRPSPKSFAAVREKYLRARRMGQSRLIAASAVREIHA